MVLLQAECSYFVSGSNTCKLYKHAVLVKNTGNIQTIAGICPKTDPDDSWIQINFYSVTTHIPDKLYFWCSGSSICTFPFYYKSELYYEPVYIDGGGKCGTSVTSTTARDIISFSSRSTYVCQGNSPMHIMELECKWTENSSLSAYHLRLYL